MSRLSRILMLTTAAAAVGSMAIVGGSNYAEGQVPPGNEDAAEAVERAQPASGDEAAGPDTPAEPPVAESDTARDAAAAAAQRREANRQIEHALAERVSFDFKEDRLRDVLAELARAGSFPLRIDEGALQDIGVSADEPVTMELEGVRLQQAFNRALRGRGLTWVVRDEVLQVTTIEEAELLLDTTVYDVAPLLQYAERHADQPRNDVLLGERFRTLPPGYSPEPFKFAPGDWVIESAQQFTAGPWENTDGTGGTISRLRDAIIVRQTYDVQRETASLLDALHAAVRGELEHGSRTVRSANYPADLDRRILEALNRKTSVDFRDMPVSSVITEIGQQTRVPTFVDVNALQDIGIQPDEAISIVLKDVTWRSALHLVLEPLGLTAIVEDGFLVMTTIEEAELYLFAEVYDVRDLAERRLGGQNLLEAIVNETSGPWEDVDGTGGAIDVPVHGILLIRHTRPVHDEVAVLLRDLREHASKSESAPTSEPNAATPPENADPSADLTRFYPVDPLLVNGATADSAVAATTPPPQRDQPPRTNLERTILRLVAPGSWRDAGHGGTGVLEKVNDVLVVRQTAAVHQELRDFLDRLENAAATAASLQGLQLQGGGLGSGGFGCGFGPGGGGGFFRLPVPEQAPR